MSGVREAKKAERRREILESAAEAFTEMGYRGTTIAGIADRMGAPKSAIGYHHFESKHEIAVEIVEYARSRWWSLIEVVSAGSGTGLEKLLTLLLSAAVDARNNVLASAAVRLAADQRVNGFALPPSEFSWRGIAHDFVWQSLESGELPREHPVEKVVSVVLTGSYGVFVSENQGFEDVRTDEHLREVWRTILPSLGVRDADTLVDGLQVIAIAESAPGVAQSKPGTGGEQASPEA